MCGVCVGGSVSGRPCGLENAKVQKSLQTHVFDISGYRGPAVVPFPQVSLTGIIPQLVRLRLTSFPWGQALLRAAACSGLLQNGSSSSPLAGGIRAFFSNISWESLVKPWWVSLANLWGSRDWEPLKIFNSQSRLRSLQHVVCYSTGFPCLALFSQPLHRWIVVLVSRLLYSSPVFPALDSEVCFVFLNLLWRLEKVSSFQSVEFFTCEVELVIFKLLTCRPKNPKSQDYLVLCFCFVGKFVFSVC